MMQEPPNRLRLLCVDDNEMLADALGRRFAHESDLCWLGVVNQGVVAYARVMELRPDIVLLDIDMPDIDSFAVAEKLAADAPDVRVLMFSGHVSHDHIKRAIDSGVWGYLSKNDDIDSLIDRIRQAGRGEFVFSKEVEAVQRAS